MTTYIRFSSLSYMTIQDIFRLSSSGLVLGVIEAALLQNIESETIDCSDVTR